MPRIQAKGEQRVGEQRSFQARARSRRADVRKVAGFVQRLKSIPVPSFGIVGGSARFKATKGMRFFTPPMRGSKGTYTHTAEYTAREQKLQKEYEAGKKLIKEIEKTPRYWRAGVIKEIERVEGAQARAKFSQAKYQAVGRFKKRGEPRRYTSKAQYGQIVTQPSPGVFTAGKYGGGFTSFPGGGPPPSGAGPPIPPEKKYLREPYADAFMRQKPTTRELKQNGMVIQTKEVYTPLGGGAVRDRGPRETTTRAPTGREYKGALFRQYPRTSRTPSPPPADVTGVTQYQKEQKEIIIPPTKGFSVISKGTTQDLDKWKPTGKTPSFSLKGPEGTTFGKYAPAGYFVRSLGGGQTRGELEISYQAEKFARKKAEEDADLRSRTYATQYFKGKGISPTSEAFQSQYESYFDKEFRDIYTKSKKAYVQTATRRLHEQYPGMASFEIGTQIVAGGTKGLAMTSLLPAGVATSTVGTTLLAPVPASIIGATYGSGIQEEWQGGLESKGEIVVGELAFFGGMGGRQVYKTGKRKIEKEITEKFPKTYKPVIEELGGEGVLRKKSPIIDVGDITPKRGAKVVGSRDVPEGTTAVQSALDVKYRVDPVRTLTLWEGKVKPLVGKTEKYAVTMEFRGKGESKKSQMQLFSELSKIDEGFKATSIGKSGSKQYPITEGARVSGKGMLYGKEEEGFFRTGAQYKSPKGESVSYSEVKILKDPTPFKGRGAPRKEAMFEIVSEMRITEPWKQKAYMRKRKGEPITEITYDVDFEGKFKLLREKKLKDTSDFLDAVGGKYTTSDKYGGLLKREKHKDPFQLADWPSEKLFTPLELNPAQQKALGKEIMKVASLDIKMPTPSKGAQKSTISTPSTYFPGVEAGQVSSIQMGEIPTPVSLRGKQPGQFLETGFKIETPSATKQFIAEPSGISIQLPKIKSQPMIKAKEGFGLISQEKQALSSIQAPATDFVYEAPQVTIPKVPVPITEEILFNGTPPPPPPTIFIPGGPPPPPPITPKVGFPLIPFIGGLRGVGLPRGRQRTVIGKKRKKKYKPSLVGIELGIKAPKEFKTMSFTGLEVRGLSPSQLEFYGKTRKKKKKRRTTQEWTIKKKGKTITIKKKTKPKSGRRKKKR